MATVASPMIGPATSGLRTTFVANEIAVARLQHAKHRANLRRCESNLDGYQYGG